MPNAARVGDNHSCTMVDPATGAPHTGGPILPYPAPDVLTDLLPAARATDRLVCANPAPDFIVTGSQSVLINNRPAARVTDKTMHGAPASMILVGSLDVEIGGPTIGATLGDPARALTIFNRAAASRASGSTQQSYQNCGVESARQIIMQASGAPVREDALLDAAMQSGHAEQAPTRADSGGTGPTERQAILALGGVDSQLQAATMDSIAQAVAEGRGVITSHEAGILWGTRDRGGHAVTVTGVKFDKNGRPSQVIINDTGTGDGAREVPARRFRRSLRPGRPANVTNDRVW